MIEPPMQEQHLAPHRGVMILVFGILGVVVCLIFGILAWIFGNADLAEMNAGRMDPTGRGMTSAGRILGMISCIFTIVVVLIWVLVLVVGGVASA